MDWNNLAASDLPSLTAYPPVTSSFLQFQLSSKNTDVKTPNAVDALFSRRQPNSTSQPTQLNEDALSPQMESLENLILQHEHTMFASMIQRCTDETRQKTTKAVDDQLQRQRDQERAVFTQSTRGEIVGKKIQELSRTSPFFSNGSNDYATSLVKPDPTFTLEHWKIVERMSRLSVVDSVEQFSRLASNASRQNKNVTSMIAYASAWQLTANLVTVYVRNSPVDQARATLSHFCKQFQVNVINRVRQAALAGQNTHSMFPNDLTAQCEVFSRLAVGTTDPWAVCFYCLRCGDAKAALQTLDQIQQVDKAVERLLVAMANTQGGSPCLWDVQAPKIRLDRSDQQTVNKLLEDADVSISGHKKAVLLLLSGSKVWPFNFEPTEGFQTIEDYLTGALWVAVLQTNPVDHLIQIGEDILNRGPSCFDDPSSGGWSFALPLLASQQYEKALVWLAQTGGPLGLLQAAHIGLALSSDGYPIRNLGQVDSNGNETTSSLLLAYSNDVLKDHGPLAAFDYVAHIPNEVRAYKEISKLIDTIDDSTAIVGTLDSEGIRQGGVLSKYFNDTEISLILIEASRILSLSTGEQHKQGQAVMCLMLAERYDDALSMLNNLISPPNIIDDDRSFWKEQVSLFLTHYINRRTHVLDIIERCGKVSVIRASRLLMELNSFFDRLRSPGNETECLVIAKKTQLLPETEADRKIKVCEVLELDPLVQASMPFLLIGVMEILKGEYTKLKRDLHRDTSGVVRERLKELNENARLLTSFASSLGISNCHIRTLSNLMSLMI
jgi:Nup93/Nic96